jgi:hypothetical protein
MATVIAAEEGVMVCPVCHGTKLLEIAGVKQPCGECGGMGVIHCCEGLVAQPELATPCEPPHAEATGPRPGAPIQPER